jgi:hypothetical protein
LASCRLRSISSVLAGSSGSSRGSGPVSNKFWGFMSCDRKIASGFWVGT